MASADSKSLITHHDGERNSLDEGDIQKIENRLNTKKDLTLPREEELRILRELTEFELGRFLLKNRGISGYWTAYWLIHGPQKELSHPLENWLIHQAPGFVASRERYHIFSQETQKRLKPDMKLASIPCGLMDDLLHLDYSNAPNAKIYGFDLDEESVKLAKENATRYGKAANSHVEKRDAWNLGVCEEFDIITSNGLNIYEPDDNKVIQLYKSFHGALKKGGVLVTSFLTPPPQIDPNSPWKNHSSEDMQKQKAIFQDIVETRWSAIRSESLTISQLEAAGFQDYEIIHDRCGLFPSVIGHKR